MKDKVEEKMTLDIKRRKDGDSKCLNEYARHLWTPKLKEDGDTECQAGQWLWMSKWRHNSERQTKEEGGSKCQTEYMTQNA